MSWVLVPCLVALRGEFNALNPARDRSSDGSVGDQAHALTASDHNPDESGATPYEDADFVDEVHAIDVDCTGPWPGRSFDALVEGIRLRHQRGEDDRLQNIIWNGWICSRSWGWTWQRYSGANPHDHHAHFSARYTTAQENDISPWGLIEEDDLPTIKDFSDELANTSSDFSKVSQATPWRLVARGADPKAGAPAMSTLAVLNGTYDTVRAALAAITANAAAEAQRDAAQSAAISGLTTAVHMLGSAKGVLTSEQVTALTEAVRQAAAAAGAQAASVVEAKLDSLREHLGDDDPTVPIG